LEYTNYNLQLITGNILYAYEIAASARRHIREMTKTI